MVMSLHSTKKSVLPWAAFRTGRRNMTKSLIRTPGSSPTWIHHAHTCATLYISTEWSHDRLLHSSLTSGTKGGNGLFTGDFFYSHSPIRAPPTSATRMIHRSDTADTAERL